MIWTTVSSWSYFCWLYRASPSLAAKNIIHFISVLTIWWCPRVKSYLTLLEEGVCLTSAFSWQNSVSLDLLHFVLQDQIGLLLQVFLDSLLLHSSPLWWKGIFVGVFILEDWNAIVGSQETPGGTGKYGLGMRNEAGQRLIEFCQENALVIENTLFQQHKRRLYTRTSSDGQHRNQIDYILCSQRWRSFIQATKTRPGADCGSDHELLITKFRLKLKKVGKTARPFRYELNWS